jgi:dGTPase
VATVGRSLGKLLENILLQNKIITQTDISSIPAILTASCLSHDIGNPPFGHSGEDAISEYFKFETGNEYLSTYYAGKIYEDAYKIKSISDECKIRDLKNFEGNAMGFRILTKYEERGLNLTCATLATFTKYPRQSFIEGEEIIGIRWNTDRVSQKKFGFFQTESRDFEMVANEVGLKKLFDTKTGNYSWARHPLAFLMEAADDICYRIIDLEDGFRIGRIPFKEAETALLEIAKKDERFNFEFYSQLAGNREKQKFSYLRSVAINILIQKSFESFLKNYNDILSFTFDTDLIKSIEDKEIVNALDGISTIVKKYIYKWQNVLSIEAAGFEILGGLLYEYVEASNMCIKCPPETRSKRASKIYDLLSEEHQHIDEDEPYMRYLKIASYVSGMTDSYAINLFQQIRGIKT